MPDITLNSDNLKIPENLVVKKDGNGTVDYEATINRLGSGYFEISDGDVPEKLRVINEDKSLNRQETFKKLAGSYSALEKKLGSGDVAPEDETKYKLDYAKLPEGTKPDPEREKSFLKYCHGLGMSNRQVQGVLDRYAVLVSEGMELQKASMQKAMDGLKKSWGEDKYDKNLKLAQKAFMALADDEDKAGINDIGNNPAMLRVLAKIGAELEEDEFVVGEGAGAEDIEKLMKSEAYWNGKHPEHNQTVKKVQEFYQKKHQKK